MIDYLAISPLQLAVGSHKAGSGKGCVQNIISWQNGDKTITDMPPCTDPMLARVTQRINDSYCTHREGDLLCPPCSIKVLELGHRTVGTNLLDHGFSPEEIRRVHVEIALLEARSVEDLARSPEKAKVCNDAVEGWLAGKVSIKEVRAKRAYAHAAHAAAAVHAAHAADAAAAAAHAAAYAAAAAAAHAAAYACRTELQLTRAHTTIDNFERITGIKAKQADQAQTEQAIAKMLEAV